MANLYEIPNMTSGMDEALIGTVAAVPSFTIFLLLFVYGVVFMGGMNAQRKRQGSADAPMWATTAGLSTLMVAIPFTLRAGLIGLEVLGIIVAITLISGFWLFMNRNRNEI